MDAKTVMGHRIAPTFVVQVSRSEEEKFQGRKDRISSGAGKPACNLTWEPMLGSYGFSTCGLLFLVQPCEHQILRAPLVWGDNSSAVPSLGQQALILTDEIKGNPTKRVHKCFHHLLCHTLMHTERCI